MSEICNGCYEAKLEIERLRLVASIFAEAESKWYNKYKDFKKIAENCVELNIENFNARDIEELNNAMIEIRKIIKND